jgi:hypothetical protein
MQFGCRGDLKVPHSEHRYATESGTIILQGHSRGPLPAFGRPFSSCLRIFETALTHIVRFSWLSWAILLSNDCDHAGSQILLSLCSLIVQRTRFRDSLQGKFGQLGVALGNVTERNDAD